MSIQLVRFATDLMLRDILDKTVAGNHTGVIAEPYLGLFTAWPGFSPTIALADLTQATYTGYARQQLLNADWVARYVGSDGKPSTANKLKLFRPSDAVTPNTVIGVFLADALTAGNLLGVELLSVAAVLADANSVLHYTPEIALDPNWVVGAGVTIL